VRDAANRLTAIASADGQTIYFEREYDGMGRLKQDRWFTNAVVKTYLYDAAGQLTNWAVSATGGWTQSRHLRYDAASRITTQQVDGAVRAYGYDLTDQLLTATGSYSYSASYDALGNRQVADGDTYTTGSLNQYTEIVSGTTTNVLSYDANGNLSGQLDWYYSHDSQGQLSYMEKSGIGLNLEYDYRRLRIYDWDYDQNSHGVYTYDAQGNLLRKEEEESGWVTEYAYADGVDQVVLMRAGIDSTARLYALVTDHLGSVVAIVDSSGALVETYEYTPFGKTTIRNPSGTPIALSAVGNTLGFTGREMQILAFGWNNWLYEFSGLYYYRNRWYSPELGRFLEPDPLYSGALVAKLSVFEAGQAVVANLVFGEMATGEADGQNLGPAAQVETVTGIFLDPLAFAQGWNLYGYVLQNPLNWIDPWGLSTSSCSIPIIPPSPKPKPPKPGYLPPGWKTIPKVPPVKVGPGYVYPIVKPKPSDPGVGVVIVIPF
jgi:RHS repeat-associated protein